MGRQDRRRSPDREPSVQPTGAGPEARSRSSDLDVLEGLDEIAGLEVLEVGQADTALEALADLTGIILETTQRTDVALPDDRAVAQEAHLRTAGDHTGSHVATGDRADLRHTEDLAHLGFTGDLLFELGLEHADDGLLDVLEELVDDLVGTNLHFFLLGELSGLAVGTHVEADDRRVRGVRQGDVVLGDPTDRSMDEADVDLVAFESSQRLGDSFEGPLHVGLEDQVHRGPLTGLDLSEDVLELRAGLDPRVLAEVPRLQTLLT